MIIAVDARPIIQPQFQGPEQRARNILAAWAKSQHEHHFHLLYAHPRAGGSLDDSLLTSLPPNFHPVEITSYNMPWDFHAGSRLLNPLARALARIKPDVYYAFTPQIPRISICPVVPTFHDLSFELDPDVRRAPASRQLRHIARRSLNYARRVHAVSSQTKYDIASVYRLPAGRIDVIYNGIDPAFPPPPPATIPTPRPVHLANRIQRPYVLSVGADIPRRNYARLLDAMQIAWQSPDNATTQWVLAGRATWPHSDIHAAARKAGVLERMRFVEAPNNTELADLYRNATLTICASSFEGFGLSVLESMACGTGSACSDMRSLREVAADSAVYFPHDDSQAIGQTISGLLEDAEYRRQLKYRGLQRAALFTWETAAQLTIASLTTACEKQAEVAVTR